MDVQNVQWRDIVDPIYYEQFSLSDFAGGSDRPSTAFNRHVQRRRASIQQHQEQLEAAQQMPPPAPWMQQNGIKSSKSMHALPIVRPRQNEAAADFRQPRDLLIDTTNRSTYR